MGAHPEHYTLDSRNGVLVAWLVEEAQQPCHCRGDNLGSDTIAVHRLSNLLGFFREAMVAMVMPLFTASFTNTKNYHYGK